MGQRCFPEEGTGKACVVRRLSHIFLLFPSLVLPFSPAAHSGLWLLCRDRTGDCTPAAILYLHVSYTLHGSNPTAVHLHVCNVQTCCELSPPLKECNESKPFQNSLCRLLWHTSQVSECSFLTFGCCKCFVAGLGVGAANWNSSSQWQGQRRLSHQNPCKTAEVSTVLLPRLSCWGEGSPVGSKGVTHRHMKYLTLTL